MRLLTRPAALLSLLSFSVIPAQAAMTPPPASGPGGKVVITSCLVMFALKSRGSSATNAGMFNNESRSEVTVTKIYELAGFDTTAFQRVTDEMCGGASRLVWAETTLGNNFGAKPVNIIDTVDFAAIEAAGRRTRLQDQNTASVSATVNLTVGATVISYDASEDNVRCNPLGASREARAQPYCALRKNQRFEGTYSTDSSTSRSFPEPIVSVEEITSTAGNVGMGAANALALMTGGRRQKLDKFTVTVDPAKYEASAMAGAAEVLTGAMRWIHEPETRPRRGRR